MLWRLKTGIDKLTKRGFVAMLALWTREEGARTFHFHLSHSYKDIYLCSSPAGSCFCPVWLWIELLYASSSSDHCALRFVYLRLARTCMQWKGILWGEKNYLIIFHWLICMFSHPSSPSSSSMLSMFNTLTGRVALCIHPCSDFDLEHSCFL